MLKNLSPQNVYIGEEFDLKNRTKSYWSKFDKNTLNTILETLGAAKEVEVNVKGQMVKQRVEK